MNDFFYCEPKDVYKEIVPRSQKNNIENGKLAETLKDTMVTCENYLKKNLENSVIQYNRPTSVIISDSQKEFLINTMYGKWFYRSELYGKVKLNSDQCSYCYRKIVNHLDHFFNKSDHPELSVAIINLIPTCSTCNEKKLQKSLYIHPYYEHIHNMEWLICSIDWKKNVEFPVPIYGITQPDSMSTDMYERLQLQINTADSFFKYVNELAVSEISSNWEGWKETYRMVGHNFFQDIFSKFVSGKEKTYGLDSWQYCLYKALFENFVDFVNKLS